ncbi:MAG TPA: hypothetical protein VHO46_02435 [Bacteroidales bacterium]|nr:hypothetical protein [Bacteroidales bacterium]
MKILSHLLRPVIALCFFLALVPAMTVNAQAENIPQTQLQTQPQAQTPAPAQARQLPQIDLTTVPIKEQLNTIEARTRIYENFRAVREDMFQKLKKNINDTLSSMQKKISSQNAQTRSLQRTIDSLNSTLSTTQNNLAEVTRSKNSVKFFGMEVEKGTYNSIMWTIIIALVAVLMIGFLVFKRNQGIVNNRNKDLDELRAEFDAYRKTSREAREKMALQHFNELKKLRGE